MNKANADEASNVIEVRFNPTNTPSSMDEYETHLTSLIDLNEDPLEGLIEEFNEGEESEESFYHDFKLSFKQDLTSMSTVLLKQIDSIKTKNARLSYYLSEMNFED